MTHARVERVKGERRVPVVDLEWIEDDTGPGPGPFLFWLILVGWPLRDVLEGRSEPGWLAVAALVCFVALYAAVVRAAFLARVGERALAALLGALIVLATGSVMGFEHRWYALFPLLGIATGVVVGQVGRRRGEALVAVGVGGVSGLGALVAWLGGQESGEVFSTWYGTAMAGVVTAIILRLVSVIGALRQAREELAQAAVEAERLRFSRDMHDLLGHTLSVMVVKAQAVRRLAERDPAIAAEQAADIETVGRRALAEVRQAVTGYRGRGLLGELDGARSALADAGIEATVRQEGGPLPPEADALFGWAVREGVTNVVRHSGAGHCAISVRLEGAEAVLEVHDDGTGPSGTTPPGNGLRGLAERLAAAEGTVEAAGHPQGGFVLRVSVPLPMGAA